MDNLSKNNDKFAFHLSIFTSLKFFIIYFVLESVLEMAEKKMQS